MKIFIDGENAIVGRIGSVAAKELLKGNEVVIFNAEKAVVSGRRETIMAKIITNRQRGGTSRKGPKVSRLSDRLLKRMIRGMLPWDRQKGKDAFKRLKCYNSGVKAEEIKNAIKLDHRKPLKSMTIKQISEALQ